MKVLGSLFSALILVIGLAACGGGDNSDSGNNAANNNGNNNNENSENVDADAAKSIFEDAGCISCHGENLEGDSGPSLQEVGSEMSEDEILDQIKNGGGGMPGDLIEGEDAEKVAAWLATKK